MSGVASQEWRDGAAYGSAVLAERLVRMSIWGVRLDDVTIRAAARMIGAESGGVALEDDVTQAVNYDR